MGFWSLLIVLLITHAQYTKACWSGWIQHGDACYHFSSTEGSWAEASAYCKAFRTKLAEPMTADQMTFLKGEVKKYPSPTGIGEYYIGGTDMVIDGEWVWASTFAKATSTYWSPGEPNNDGGIEDCMAITNSGTWNDVPCGTKLTFICETLSDEGQGVIG